MAKTIKFSFEGRDYTLEFTRSSVANLERQNFNINEVSEKPITMLPLLFRGAFIANHRYVKQEVVDSIFDRITDKQELVWKLADMYNDTIESLLDEPEDSEGNLEWEASW